MDSEAINVWARRVCRIAKRAPPLTDTIDQFVRRAQGYADLVPRRAEMLIDRETDENSRSLMLRCVNGLIKNKDVTVRYLIEQFENSCRGYALILGASPDECEVCAERGEVYLRLENDEFADAIVDYMLKHGFTQVVIA